MTVALHVLGPLVASVAGTAVALPGPKPRALLTALALNHPKGASAEQLVDAVWGEAPPASADNALQVYVSRLRKALGVEAIETTPVGYRLTDATLDAIEFEAGAKAGATALQRGNPAAALDLLRDALALWRGPALVDVAYSDFAQAEARRLEELRLVATEDRLEAELALGSDQSLVAQLESLVDEHPLRERLWAQLILALYRAGRQADALRTFSKLRTTLAEELGIDPSPELVSLEQAILVQRPELTWRPLSSSVLTTALPAAIASQARGVFVGRAAELDSIDAAFDRAITNALEVVVITGPPGIGKSHLAAHAARRLAARGARVLHGACEEHAATPLGALVEALDHFVASSPQEQLRADTGPDAAALGAILPALARLGPVEQQPAADPETERQRSLDAIVATLARVARATPVVLVIDDVHWADPTTDVGLDRLVRTLGGSSVLLLLTARNTPTDVGILGRVLGRGSTIHLPLPSFGEDDARALLDALGAPLAEHASALWRSSEGNPFFLVHLARRHARSDRRSRCRSAERLAQPAHEPHQRTGGSRRAHAGVRRGDGTRLHSRRGRRRVDARLRRGRRHRPQCHQRRPGGRQHRRVRTSALRPPPGRRRARCQPRPGRRVSPCIRKSARR